MIGQGDWKVRVYQHYKGAVYITMCATKPLGEGEEPPSKTSLIAYHTETGEPVEVYHHNGVAYSLTNISFVIYSPIAWFPGGKRFARPYDMFYEEVEYRGSNVERFKDITEQFWSGEFDEQLREEIRTAASRTQSPQA